MTWFHWVLVVVCLLGISLLFLGLYAHSKAEAIKCGRLAEECPGEYRSLIEGGDGAVWTAVLLLIIMFLLGVGQEAVPKLMGG